MEVLVGTASNGWSPIHVGWRDVGAWAELRRIALAPWEALVLIRLGSLLAAVRGKAMAERKHPESAPKGRR